MRSFTYILALALALATSLSVRGQSAVPLKLKVRLLADGITAPVAMASPNDGTGRLFVCEQPGVIRVIQRGKLLPEPFLDLTDKLVNISSSFDERGLLGIAFHPHFKTNGRFFVYYSAPSDVKGSDHRSILAEYKAASAKAKTANPQEKVILSVEQPQSNHNGGQLAFGPDGYLYVALGDGGGGGDKHGEIGNGQDTQTLLGSILRLDIDKGDPYAIPADNPFADGTGGLKEIYAYGLRNPWRFSFDLPTGRIFCADVGQNKYEEVSIIEKGKNYGWRLMEGLHCFKPADGCDRTGLVLPIDEYDHGVGTSITGGYVLRNSKKSQLYGKYIFGDWGSGRLFYLTETKPGTWQRGDLTATDKSFGNPRINSFGEDTKGQLYILTQQTTGPRSKTGMVYLIEE